MSGTYGVTGSNNGVIHYDNKTIRDFYRFIIRLLCVASEILNRHTGHREWGDGGTGEGLALSESSLQSITKKNRTNIIRTV
jgi:hypothetical protein